MTPAPSGRRALTTARRIVVKIGSRTLAQDPSVFDRIAESAAWLASRRKELVVVSSGSIAMGSKKLGYRGRPREMAKLQAAAAAGQAQLVAAYDRALVARNLAGAQVLLTHQDLADRNRANNARAAISALIDAACIPILNENDSVSVDEIRFGDNDQLAAMVVPLVGAEALILLSDVEGVIGGGGRILRSVSSPRAAMKWVQAPSGDARVGTGGMQSKLGAAERATLAGAHVVIASATRPNVIESIFGGRSVGTYFPPSKSRLSARRHWIAFTLRPRGEIILDEGAERAVRRAGKSVLAVGVRGVRGDFRAGDAIAIVDAPGREFARGLARCSAEDATVAAGSAERAARLGISEIVHRDDLVVWDKTTR